MENILIFTFILVIAELFEAYLQRAKTLLGILENLYYYYKKSIFFFFLIQPSFYIILYVILMTGTLNGSMIFLLMLKVFDIFYKIEMIKKIFIEQVVSIEMLEMLEWNIPSYFFLIGVLMYPPLLFYALS